MIAREYQRLGVALFTGGLVHLLLALHKDELGDQVDNGIPCENILPHVGNAVPVLVDGIARARVHTLAAAHVEGQKDRGVLVEPGGHVDLFQVHGEVDDAPCLESEEARLGAAGLAVLQYGVVVRLPGGVALEFKGHYGKAVQEDHQIDALVVRSPNLLHHGEDVVVIQPVQRLVERGGGPGVHQVDVPVGDLHAVFQRLHQGTLAGGNGLVDDADHGLLHIGLEDLPQLGHPVRLGPVQKLKQHPPIHGKKAVVVRRFPDAVAVYVTEIAHDLMLVFLFGKDVVHNDSPM